MLSPMCLTSCFSEVMGDVAETEASGPYLPQQPPMIWRRRGAIPPLPLYTDVQAGIPPSAINTSQPPTYDEIIRSVPIPMTSDSDDELPLGILRIPEVAGRKRNALCLVISDSPIQSDSEVSALLSLSRHFENVTFVPSEYINYVC